MTPHPAVAFAALILLGGCGTTTAETQTTTPDTTTTTSTPPASSTIATITPATATMVAEPVVERTSTLPPFDCQAYIDNLPWEWLNRDIGNEAYTVGASCRGWDQATIDKWRPFVVDDVWAKESGWCWNLLRGGIIGTYLGCVLDPQGRFEDAGIGQLTRAFYGPDGYVCQHDGYCNKWAIIATPYDSVMAALSAIEGAGKGGYCYDTRSRAYHPSCAITPRYWP